MDDLFTNLFTRSWLLALAGAAPTLGDAIRLRNLLIERLEEADAECAASRWLLDLMRVSLCGYLT